jgi:predicted nucleic acid-binding protein
MTEMPLHFVFDASVLIKYLVPEAETPMLKRLMHLWLENDATIIRVPDLLFIECANILRKKAMRGEVDVPTVVERLRDLDDLSFSITSMHALMHRALELAYAHQISAYDASYVALADLYDVPLLTADQRLVRQLAETHYQLLSIEEIAEYPS